jgi:predicted GNAT family N-acyltransferase
MSSTLRLPVALADHHFLDDFDCGEAELNAWLVGRARYNQTEGYSQTFVIANETYRVLAFSSLAAGMIEREQLPRSARTGQAPRQIPVVVLGRLAVDRSAQGQKLGERMLQFTIKTCLTAANLVAVRAIIVDALDDKAQQFYLRYGFQSTKISPYKLVLPLRNLVTLD